MKNIEAKVGAFVVISVIVLGVSIYYVSKSAFRGKQVPYRSTCGTRVDWSQEQMSCLAGSRSAK